MLAKASLARFGDDVMTTHGQEILIAGWSEARDRPEAYLSVSNPAKHPHPGVKAFDLWPVPSPYFMGPVPDDLSELTEAGYPAPGDVEGFDAEAHGVPIFEISRRTASPSNPADPASLMYGVGGFIEHVAITREGIDRQIVRVWPDEVGRAIEPITLQPSNEAKTRVRLQC